MNNNKFGVIAKGIKLPIIKAGDDLKEIVVNSIIGATSRSGLHKVEYDLNDKDVIGITESIVARSQCNYVSIDEITQEIEQRFGYLKTICLINPIYSRNRFAMILKAIARAAKKVVIYMPKFDEVGNYHGINPFTGINIEEYYKEIIKNEGKEYELFPMDGLEALYNQSYPSSIDAFIYCGLHNYEEIKEIWQEYYFDRFISLADICADKCEWGLLGSNKATEEKLKLFPNKEKAQKLVEEIQEELFNKTGKKLEVMVYGDGCFHSPKIGGVDGSSIWEFADPVVSPAYTKGLEGTPNEIKIKAFADDKYKHLKGEELDSAIKNEIKEKEKDLIGKMDSQGTTPRQYNWLLGSLMDLMSGSGDKGTPVVLIQNYFNNYAD